MSSITLKKKRCKCSVIISVATYTHGWHKFYRVATCFMIGFKVYSMEKT